jgi:cytochrome P450
MYHTSEQNIQILGYLGFVALVYNKVMKHMQRFDWPQYLKLLKKRIKSEHISNPDSENFFFAFTGKAVEDVALNKYDSFKKSGGFTRLAYAMGAGLFTAEEPKHMNNKKEISPAFDNDHIKKYEDQADTIVDKVLSGWSGEIDVRNQMKFVVFKSIMEIFFSENADDDFEKIKNGIEEISESVAFDQNYKGSGEKREQAYGICQRIVDDRLASGENKNDIIDMLISSYNNGKINFEDMYSETLSIFMGGYETSAHTLEWAMYYLATNKEWQEKVSEKENLEAFIKEVLRIAPPIWLSQRVSIEDVVVDGTHVPAGTEISMSSYVTHRDENVFEDPESFKPERWFENPKLSKGEYFPFMFGKRQCVGKEYALMQLRLVISKVAENFNIEIINPNIHHIGGIAYRTSEPIRMYVTKK